MCKKFRSSSNSVPPWLELPPEIMSVILQKSGAIEMLTTVQKVCSAWRSLCRDPSLWRCINLHNRPPSLWRCINLHNRSFYNLMKDLDANLPQNLDELEKMGMDAVDRSQGQLVDINIEYFGTDELLVYISQRCTQLKRLKLVYSPCVSGDGLIQATKNLPLLEELHLYCPRLNTEKAIEAIGRSCPLLKSLSLNDRFIRRGDWDLNLEAETIAISMPQLRHLMVFGNTMSNNGLRAILEGCPYLESLDIRQCFKIHFGGEIGRLCTQRIKDLRRPWLPSVREFNDNEGIGKDDLNDAESDSDFVDYFDNNGGRRYSDMCSYYSDLCERREENGRKVDRFD